MGILCIRFCHIKSSLIDDAKLYVLQHKNSILHVKSSIDHKDLTVIQHVFRLYVLLSVSYKRKDLTAFNGKIVRNLRKILILCCFGVYFTAKMLNSVTDNKQIHV